MMTCPLRLSLEYWFFDCFQKTVYVLIYTHKYIYTHIYIISNMNILAQEKCYYHQVSIICAPNRLLVTYLENDLYLS